MGNNASLLFVLLASFLLLAGCASEAKPPANGANVSPYELVNDTPLPPKIPSAPEAPIAPEGMKIFFLDAGFGDSTLIQMGGKAILFDAGPSSSSAKIENALSDAGVDIIDVLILSSNATEHIGGARQIGVYHVIREVWHNGVNYTDAAYADALAIPGAKKRAVEYGDTFAFGKGKITILNPQKQKYLASSGPDSIALKAEYGDFCALVFSDSEGSGASGSDAGTVFGGIDSKIISGGTSVKCQIVKVGNHGSGNAASFQLLDVVKPDIAVISVGANPGSQLPSPALVARLQLKNISVLRTDTMGTIWATTYGLGYDIFSEK